MTRLAKGDPSRYITTTSHDSREEAFEFADSWLTDNQNPITANTAAPVVAD